jgi:SAM-dependent methyltransferase
LGTIDRSLNYGRHHIAAVAAALQPNTVLDLGAGPGADLLAVKSVAAGARLFAAECYPPNIRKLSELGVSVHKLDLERDRLPFPDNSIDMIVANQVLEHCKEVWWILHECTRVLRTGGHLAIGVPNLASLHNRILLLFGRQPTPIQNNSAHVRGYTRSDFLKLVNSGFPGGYQLKNWGGSNFYPFPAFMGKVLANWFPSMAWGMFLDLEKKRDDYDSGFLRFPLRESLETNFYLGPSNP